MRFYLLFITVLFMMSPCPIFALEPIEVAVIANSNVGDSVKLARYYMKQRGIPEENLVRIDTASKESCSRKTYNEEIAGPVREFIASRQGKKAIRCLVTMSGIPLKVGAPELNRSEKKELETNRKELTTLKERLKNLQDSTGVEAKRLKQQIAAFEHQVKVMGKQDQKAAVDSELALVMTESYPLQRWVPNPFFAGFQGRKMQVAKSDVLMVARLDGPSAKVVRRMIDDSLAAEAVGLQGTAYFDARWSQPAPQKQLQGNAFYDNSLHLAAERVKSKKINTVVNDQQTLFQPGEAPEAALYAGWYSLARYVDAFDWVPGAVGFHIASQECQTLQGNSKYWCKSMLEDGAAATIGPVAEPYLTAFPVPEIFFKALTDGYYTLAEAYFLSLPYLSWQMILVGDPLYRPFKK
jgi:uncharacterized protein (TIGR03790 family)